MTFAELVDLVSAADGPNICVDSRLVRPGDVFVALAGTACDGHDFIEQAVANGARYVVCRSGQPEILRQAGTTTTETIVADDSAEAAGILAQAAKGKPADKLTNLAVTGTNGKTTVAFLVRSIIQQAGQKCGLVGTVTYDTCSGDAREAALTTPDCITIAEMTAQMVENAAEYMVIEASSHALSQNRLAGLKFKAAAFTNLAGDHLDYHKTEEEYLAAKTTLFKSLRPDATAILNRQSPHAQIIAAQTQASISWYAIDMKADITAHIQSMDTSGTSFALEYGGQTKKVRTPLPGLYNVSNCLAAAGLCLAAGLDLQTVACGLSALRVIPGRLEKVDWPGDFTVLIDYAHTDDALKNVLSTLKPLCAGRLIVVFGCGGDRDRTKRPRMARVAEKYADLVVVTSDNPRTEPPERIIEEIVAGFEKGAHIAGNASNALRDTRYEIRDTKIVEADRKKAIQLAIEAAQKDDIVLIAGKGHETYQIIGTRKSHFSDMQIARQCLTERVRD